MEGEGRGDSFFGSSPLAGGGCGHRVLIFVVRVADVTWWMAGGRSTYFWHHFAHFAPFPLCQPLPKKTTVRRSFETTFTSELTKRHVRPHTPPLESRMGGKKSAPPENHGALPHTTQPLTAHPLPPCLRTLRIYACLRWEGDSEGPTQGQQLQT